MIYKRTDSRVAWLGWYYTGFIIRKIIVVERENQKLDAQPWPRLAVENCKGRDLWKEILPQRQSALKWGLGEVEPGCTPPGHTVELPPPVLLWLSQSLPQAINQWFRL